MNYPRTIILKSDKLRKLLEQKAELVTEGRALSDEIIAKESELEDIDKKIQEVEKTVDVTDLKEQAEGITAKFNAVMDEMDALKKQMYQRMREKVGEELPGEYESRKKEKEALEIMRNKIGLRIQKFNDKIIPIGRKLMKEHLLGKYEDYDTLRIENGEIVATIFSHLHDFEVNFEKRKNKN